MISRVDVKFVNAAVTIAAVTIAVVTIAAMTISALPVLSPSHALAAEPAKPAKPAKPTKKAPVTGSDYGSQSRQIRLLLASQHPRLDRATLDEIGAYVPAILARFALSKPARRDSRGALSLLAHYPAAAAPIVCRPLGAWGDMRTQRAALATCGQVAPDALMKLAPSVLASPHAELRDVVVRVLVARCDATAKRLLTAHFPREKATWLIKSIRSVMPADSRRAGAWRCGPGQAH